MVPVLEGSPLESCRTRKIEQSKVLVMSISILPDDVLLEIFDFYLDNPLEEEFLRKDLDAWQLLVHVCRRWRSVVFGSPRRLNLEIVCSPGTPARDTLDVWPALPLCVEDSYGPDLIEGFDNILAALERRDRVHEINLISIPSSHLEKVLDALREPFPKLTDLALWCEGTQRVIPHDLFGGPAPPRLGGLELCGISFLGLPRFLSSATHLHTLILVKTSDFVRISPDEMVASLSMMTGLISLRLKFKSFWPDRTIRPPPTRTVFPALTYFWFEGASKYLENLVARIDAPQLKKLSITFFSQITSDTPQFIQFVSRTRALKPLEKARVIFLEGLQPSGPVQEDPGKFVAARQLSGHPIAVSPGKENRGCPCRSRTLNWTGNLNTRL